MLVVFGSTLNDNNNLVKEFTTINEVNANLKKDTSIINPVFEISYTELSNLKNINYCYVADFGRYYYVDNIDMGVGGIMFVNCSVDVLMSFKDSIKNIEGTVKRAENLSNGYIIDDNYKSLAYSNIVTKRFPHAMENDTFVLMTVG